MNKVINIDNVQDTKLYRELVNRNDEDTKMFVANILALCEEASDRAKQIPNFFSEYTLHDRTHFIRVTELMALILGDNVKELNSIEIGLLILSAFYHDQGMLIDNEEYKSLEENEDYLIFRGNWIIDHGNYSEVKQHLESSVVSLIEKENLLKAINELNSAMLTDFLRESHGQRSYNYIVRKFNIDARFVVNGTNISDYLAKICLSHVKSTDWINNINGFNYDENIGRYKVNTIFLSLVLRLADILDFDSDRTPEVLFKSIHFTSHISIKEWKKHRDVKGWEISRQLVRYTMYFEHPVYEKTAHIFLDWVDNELKSCHALIKRSPSYVNNYQIEIAEVVDRSRLGPKNNAYIYHDLEFSLSRDEIVKLLLTDKLYKNPSLFIRELLQNSLDALRFRNAIYQKDNLKWEAGEVLFRHYIDSDNQEVIECTDNGCGMDESIISKFLGKVGRSFYRSPEFERQRAQFKEVGVDFEPCSQFGIGFMSCFMIGDRIQIMTRKDYGSGKEIGKPLIVEINGLGGLIIIKEGSNKQKIGTTIKVFSRDKPLFFDDWTDKVRLLLTLKGYALATEFPIKATCEIKEIEGDITIPSSIDKKITFLETLNLKNIITYEVNLNEIDKNLYGFLRQTFLIDESNIPCLENDEAKWLISKPKARLNKDFEMNLLVKENNQLHKYDQYISIRESLSVCLDGILVCGYPGRDNASRFETSMLGHLYSWINSEHPFTIDVRGNLKPELNPAREPLDTGGAMRRPIGWRNLQNIVSKGGGIIWSKVLVSCNSSLSPDVFWKLLIIHDGSPFHIPSQLLYQFLKVPILDGSWINISSIKLFNILHDSIVVTDYKENKHTLSFPDEFNDWGKTATNGIDFKYWLINILISMSKYRVTTIDSVMVIRDFYESNEVLNDVIITQTMSAVRIISFEGLDKSYFTTNMYNNIANSENALCKLALNSKYIKRKDELQQFAEGLIFNICHLIQQLKEKGKPFTVNVVSRPLRYTSLLFLNIDWTKYSDDFKPPYKIYVNENETISLTENNFKMWAKVKYKEE